MEMQRELSSANQDRLAELRSKFGGLATDVSLSRFDWRALMESGAIVQLSVGRYRGIKTLTADDLGLDVEEMKQVDSIVQLGHRLLLPQDTLNAFNTLETRARQVVRQYCLLTPAGLFLPAKAYDGCKSAIEEFRLKFFDLVELLIQDLPAHRRTVEDSYNDLARQVYRRLVDGGRWDWTASEYSFRDEFVNRCMAQFPTSDELRKCFRFSLSLSFVPTPYETQSELPSFANATNDLIAQRRAVLEDQKRARDELVNGFINSVQSEVYGLVNTALTDVLASVEKNSVLQGKSITQLKNLVEKLSTLNFWEDKRLDQIAQEIQTILDQPSAKRDTSLNTDIIRELQFQTKYVLGNLGKIERGDMTLSVEAPRITLAQSQAPVVAASKPMVSSPVASVSFSLSGSNRKLF